MSDAAAVYGTLSPTHERDEALADCDQPRRLDLRSLLARAEGAAPVGVVEAMGEALHEMLDARDVRFLIADFSGVH